MQLLKSWAATVNRWRVYKFTALAVLYGVFIVIAAGPLSYHDAVLALVWTHPVLAALAIYGFTFRRPIV